MLPFPVGVEDARFVLNELTSKAIEFRQWNRSLLVLNTFNLLTCLHPTPTRKSATFYRAVRDNQDPDSSSEG
ncbi:hypothetical protein ASF99_07865 [Exiguobacterium sp. Leaf187]|nr:hypothetical protein ASF99_07865 [Exiguobacterium sp. Leaf187]